MDNRPVGIFDSGVGGLTVVKEVMKQLNNESIIYFGDTARVPYGTKSKNTVTKFAIQIIRFLLQQDVKAIIIACNTVNSNCIEELRNVFPDVIIEGVVEPGVKMALSATKNGRIGVIGTEATIASNRYTTLLTENHKDYRVYNKACPLFVPLVEDGWQNKQVTIMVIEEYLKELKTKDIDTLILGCTHYPILHTALKQVVGDNIQLINPANEAAHSMGERLLEKNIAATHSLGHKFYVSDHPEKMKDMAKMFLGYTINEVVEIDIENY
ncbi:MAG: glutamate racemase [Epulopiscium sp. Nuni2H_MBin003]|nr:MAG: glutamate racemase [Epulopiscium sp. Nuni2H_MBin003]